MESNKRRPQLGLNRRAIGRRMADCDRHDRETQSHRTKEWMQTGRTAKRERNQRNQRRPLQNESNGISRLPLQSQPIIRRNDNPNSCPISNHNGETENPNNHSNISLSFFFISIFFCVCVCLFVIIIIVK